MTPDNSTAVALEMPPELAGPLPRKVELDLDGNNGRFLLVDEYVRGQVHTQGIENFWSLLKRGLNGTYVAVEPFHLDRYIDEQIFRYNHRGTKDNPLNDADRFMLAVSQIADKRLTYAELTGKVAGTQPF